jgi:hypothetical protein
MSEESRSRIGDLIFVPALITLAVTLIRLAGELMQWSPALFSAEAGGGGALVGISWLPFVFGPWFAIRLVAAGDWHGSLGRALGWTLLGLAIVPASGLLAALAGMDQQSLGVLIVFAVAAVVAVPVAMRGWPALGRTLLAYAFAARVPVVLVMLVAILGDWGTHYDVPPPDFPAMGPWARWMWIGLVPQMTIWIAYTVVVGSLFGGVAAAIAAKRRRGAAPAG